MLRSARFRVVALLAVVLAMVAAGCSKKVTDPLPTPEGQQDGSILLMGWHEQPSVAFFVVDPGSPTDPSDDVLGDVALDFWADTAGVRSMSFDLSKANQLEALRRNANGDFEPLYDYLLNPSARLIGRDFDLFEFEDVNPTPNPIYAERGAVDGTITKDSPVSNFASALPGFFDENMVFVPPTRLGISDSILKVQFVDDPRAAFYTVEINAEGAGLLANGNAASIARRISGIPSPVVSGTQSFALTAILVMPGGSGLTGLRVPLSLHWPVVFYIRVTAFDEQGRMVNRVNNYLHTRVNAGGNNFELYEPLGGAIQIMNPYPVPGPPPFPDLSVLTRDQALDILFGFLGGRPAGPANMLSQMARSLPTGSSVPTAANRALERALASSTLSRYTGRQGVEAALARLRAGQAGAAIRQAVPVTR